VALKGAGDGDVGRRLHPDDVAAIASQVADRLVVPQHPRLVDTATLAEVLGVSPGFVRAHADQLGAVRIGNGPKARLRFDIDQARAALARASSASPSKAASSVARPYAAGRRTSVPLLPVRGRKAV
jgi:hypothetical protein